MEWFGWRSLFHFVGALGLIWCFFLKKFNNLRPNLKKHQNVVAKKDEKVKKFI